MGKSGQCPVCDRRPRVLLMMRHPTMLRFTRELLEREFGCWVAAEANVGEATHPTADAAPPDLLIVDTATFPACCAAALARVAPGRIIVTGPEPDASYRSAAIVGRGRQLAVAGGCWRAARTGDAAPARVRP